MLYRHDSAQGVPKAKNAEVNAVHGEVILLLDDDNLLMPDALEVIFNAYSNFPKIDGLFLGVRPFGPYADGPARNRDTALGTLINNSNPEERDVFYFFTKSPLTQWRIHDNNFGWPPGLELDQIE